MSIQSRLDDLALKKRRHQALLEAVRAGLVPGVAAATEHFERVAEEGPRTVSRHPEFDLLATARVDERSGGRVLVFRSELEFEQGGILRPEQPYRVPVGDLEVLGRRELLAHLVGPRDAAESVDPCDIAFLDTETSGLAGGTGTIAFLVGVGWLERGADGAPARFVLEQFLVEDFCHERAQLEAVCERLAPFRAFCTYNGRTFDVPLLRTRGVMNRLRPTMWARPNLDLLPFARRLWKGGLPSVSLGSVERHILSIAREQDVPGSEVPGIWLDYARTGAPGRMPLVLHHNAQDIASLVSLLALHARFLRDPLEPGLASRPCELRGMARWHDKRGDFALACRLLERAFEISRREEDEDARLMDLARAYRRAGRHDDAVSVWRGMQSRPLAAALPAWIELAKWFEHRARDVRQARLLVHQCLRQWELESDLRSMTGRAPVAGSDAALEDLRKRLARLDRKVARGEAKKT